MAPRATIEKRVSRKKKGIGEKNQKNSEDALDVNEEPHLIQQLNMPENFDSLVTDELAGVDPNLNLGQETDSLTSARATKLCNLLQTVATQTELDSVFATYVSLTFPRVTPITEGAPSREFPDAQHERTTAEINALYERNRKLCIATLKTGQSPRCRVPSENLFGYFLKQRIVNVNASIARIPERHHSIRDNSSLIAPFSREEIVTKLSHSNKSSSPGPSGLSYSDLANGPTIDFMLGLFNTILRTRITPTAWKRSKLTMIFRSGDKTAPSSWRPITGQETMSKIFTGILADRLQSFSRMHSLLPVWQRATAGSDGCHNCNLAVDVARDEAKT